ncbi:MAG: glycine--tRNA ligase subunit beta [Alphaproteobacteria bacterium]|nr:glycine--tRNA ligase subunit beta [Alphaproteobacteria bacterium]
MNNKDLVLELYSEEIPAAMQQAAAAQLEKRISEFLKGFGLEGFQCSPYAAPQRIALLVEGLPAELPARIEEKKGPRTDAPTKAIEGFLRANNLDSVAGLATREDKKGSFYVLEINEEGQSLSDALAAFLPDMIRNFQWQKSMRWGAGQLRWVRPLHKILCCFGGEVVSFEIDGIVSGDTTMGHRFMHNKPVKITHAKDYLDKLRNAKVIADVEEREEMIKAQANKVCGKEFRLKNNQERLIREVAGLVEYPVPLLGSIDEKFMSLPSELLESVMRTHQKYLYAHIREDTAKLAPAFIVVTNGATNNTAKIIAGNERVLSARFSDAQFFIEQDIKTTLAEKREKLRDVIFYEKIGTLYEKTQRIEKIAIKIANTIGANVEFVKDAAAWCKSDLVSHVVFEFPEMQGIMGGALADAQNLDATIGLAIHNHYMPVGEGDFPLLTDETAAVALADKLDTLTQFWIIDEKPTGSRDPYALRRAALGVIRITMAGNTGLPLREFLYDIFLEQTNKAEAIDLTNDLLEFMLERLKTYMRDKKNIPYDVLNAVLEVNQFDGNLWEVSNHVEDVKSFITTDDGRNLLSAYNRAFGICKSEKKLPDMQNKSSVAIDENIYSMEQEKKLAHALHTKENKFELKDLATLRQPVDDFFENVLVNDEDPKVRANRFAILQNLIITMRRFAAFELIEKTD